MTEASAPGKLILCGEHAVVYGRPAIALPLRDVRAHVGVEKSAPGSGITFVAADLDRCWTLADNPADPLSELATNLLDSIGITAQPDLRINISSTIPIASGMGSGAAVATALARALAAHLGHDLTPDAISRLVYASERHFHGTPSGIDNTVIAYEQAIWFVKQPAAALDAQHIPVSIAVPLTLLIGDTGVRSATRLPVGDLRRRWQDQPKRYEALFDAIATLVVQARQALAHGDIDTLGWLLDENHTLLQQIGVSSPELDRLVSAARAAGALGAKLSGAGWGGVMLALVPSSLCEPVASALAASGAARVIATTVEPDPAARR